MGFKYIPDKNFDVLVGGLYEGEVTRHTEDIRFQSD